MATTDIGYDLLRNASYLALGLDPVWYEQDEVPGGASDELPIAPSLASHGTDVEDYVLALVSVRLRRNAAYQQAWFYVTYVDTETYTITIDGVDIYSYLAGGGDDEQAILEGLQLDIGSDYATEIVTDLAAMPDSVASSADVALRVWSEYVPDNHTWVPSATGSAELEVSYEASYAEFDIHVLPTNLDSPYFVPNGFDTLTAAKNWLERVEVSGMQRLNVQVTATDGLVLPSIGVCKLPGAE